MRAIKFTTTVCGCLLLAACATSHVLIDQPRPPISPDEVQFYTQPPTVPYDEIARLDTSSQVRFHLQRKQRPMQSSSDSKSTR
jgi:hypothetical protein